MEPDDARWCQKDFIIIRLAALLVRHLEPNDVICSQMEPNDAR